MFLNQAAGGGVPDQHAALFQFLNQAGDPIARQISLLTAFSGEPVVLDPGEAVFATLGWFMYAVDDCKSQTVRVVVDFESEQCSVPDPEETDLDAMLDAIANLPEDCLGPPLPACSEFEGPLRFDFGTSIPGARRILDKEIVQGFSLDGQPLPVGYQSLTLFKYLLGGGDPEAAPSLVCSDDLYYSPIYAYFNYGYQIAPQTGKCLIKGSGTLLQDLEPGTYEFQFQGSLDGVPLEFPPITLIQN